MSFYDALFPDYKSINKCNRTNFFPREFSQVNCTMTKISYKQMPSFCPFNILEASICYRETIQNKKVIAIVIGLSYSNLAPSEWMNEYMNIWVSWWIHFYITQTTLFSFALPSGREKDTGAIRYKFYVIAVFTAERFGPVSETQWLIMRILPLSFN